MRSLPTYLKNLLNYTVKHINIVVVYIKVYSNTCIMYANTTR